MTKNRTERANLNTTVIKRLKPRSKDYTILDDNINAPGGLGVRIYPSGRKSWVVKSRNAVGKTIRKTVGDALLLKPEDARIDALEIVKTIKTSGSPERSPSEQRKKKQEDENFTIQQALNAYLDHSALTTKARSTETIEEVITRHCRDNKLFNLQTPILSLTPEIIRRWYFEDERNKNRHASTENAYRYLKAIVEYALDENEGLEIGGTSPFTIKKKKRYKSDPRDTLLESQEQLPAFLWALVEERNSENIRDKAVVIDYILFTLMTGLRSKIGRSLHWKYVKEKQKVIAIPKGADKNSQAFDIPLVGLTRTIVNARKNDETYRNEEFIFPNKPSSSYLGDIRKVINRIVSRANTLWGSKVIGQEVEEYRTKSGRKMKRTKTETCIHDWRRTFSTSLFESGAPYIAQQVLLNHKPREQTQDYTKVNEDSKQEVITNLSAYYSRMLHLRFVQTDKERKKQNLSWFSFSAENTIAALMYDERRRGVIYNAERLANSLSTKRRLPVDDYTDLQGLRPERDLRIPATEEVSFSNHSEQEAKELLTLIQHELEYTKGARVEIIHPDLELGHREAAGF